MFENNSNVRFFLSTLESFNICSDKVLHNCSYNRVLTSLVTMSCLSNRLCESINFCSVRESRSKGNTINRNYTKLVTLEHLQMADQIFWSSGNGRWLFVRVVSWLHSNVQQFLRAWSMPCEVAFDLGEMMECISRNPDHTMKYK